MIRHICTARIGWIAAAILALTPLSSTASPIGYTVNFSGQFGTIDLGTGVFTPIGGGLPNTPDGIGGAPGGPFYTVDASTGHLLRIAPNGVVFDVGDTGTGPNVGPTGISVMGSLTNGSLYGLDFSNFLYSFNTATGAGTKLGLVPGLPTQESEYIGNMTTSFNGHASALFFTLEISDGPNQTGPTLFTINPFTRASTSLALTGLSSRLIGSGFVGGTMYGFSEFGDIVTINIGTGSTQFVAHYDSGSDANNPGPPFTGLFGVVAVPESASVWLVVTGVVGIGVLTRRTRRSALRR